MPKLILLTVIFIGPAYAALMGIVYVARLALPSGHVIYEQVEEYLWAPAGLIALAAAGLVAALTGTS